MFSRNGIWMASPFTNSIKIPLFNAVPNRLDFPIRIFVH